MRTMKIMRALAVAAALAALPSAAYASHDVQGPFDFYRIEPCRVVDTRGPASVNGGPAVTSATRVFSIRGACGVPMNARAVTLNVTILGASHSSFITMWPADLPKPGVSTINFLPTDIALANGAITGLAQQAGDLAVANGEGSVHLILDVTGYFK